MSKRKIVMAPSTKRWRCSKCGCTETRACEGGCYWAAYRTCSACATADQLARFAVQGPRALMTPKQPAGTSTMEQLAVLFAVNASTLTVRLWDAGIVADGTWQDGRYHRNTYSTTVLRAITAYLRDHPIRQTRGRPLSRRRKGGGENNK